MTSSERVLQLLENNREHYISGEELASHLQLSRQAVWKAMENLRDQGHVIEGVSHCGYRLLTSNTVVSLAVLKEQLQEYEVHVFDSLDSTNRYAKMLASEARDKKALVIATHQSGGRGRLGRSFFSPKGGLYLSLVFPLSFPLDQAQLLTSAAAVATATAIDMVCGKDCAIKWVNDLFLEGKKVCGILTEGVLGVESGRLSAVVVGIGINVSIAKAAFPEALQEIATSLYDGENAIPPTFDANALVVTLVEKLEKIIDAFPDRSFLETYRCRSLVLGKKVTVHQGGKSYIAWAKHIDEDAHLVVEDEQGAVLVLSSAEISVRLEA